MELKARIYQPSKTAMQSGRGKTQNWVLEYVSHNHHTPDALMGWPTMNDTMPQVKLAFDTKEEALSYAKSKKIVAQVLEPKTKQIPPKSYAANFAHQRRK